MSDMADPNIEPAAYLIEPGRVRAPASPHEWTVRVDLATCYRCAALYRMNIS